MSQIVNLIPDSAPFNEEQRAWLNGFMAGWLGLQSEAGVDAVAQLAGNLLPELPAPQARIEEEEPWHDPSLPMEDRLALADGKPIENKLMAAMAQLDCGSCGYVCKTYAKAIADGDEKSLKLCSPGGTETAKKLKELVKLNGNMPPINGQQANGHANNGKAVNGQATNGILPGVKGRAKDEPASRWSRLNPFPATVLKTANLNGPGSSKQTTHVEIDLSGGDLTYAVGDSLGVFPVNCDQLVNALLDRLDVPGDHNVTFGDGGHQTLRETLANRCCLTEVTDEFLEALVASADDPAELELLRNVLGDADKIAGWDVLDLLLHCPKTTIDAETMIATLGELKPRLYSISSSMKAHPGQVHLTVGRVAWNFRDRGRKGVTSTMFADRMQAGDTVRVFVQPSHGFTVPIDPNAPAIMIGPGTGIAPFRAFLQERAATGAHGDNWLLFGDQHAASDFLYREELERYRSQGLLTRIDTAFSRDQAAKLYVQDRLTENAAAVWDWLKRGAHIYVCGDAKRMAVDVDKALQTIVAGHGHMNADEAKKFMGDLAKAKRYCRDVY